MVIRKSIVYVVLYSYWGTVSVGLVTKDIDEAISTYLKSGFIGLEVWDSSMNKKLDIDILMKEPFSDLKNFITSSLLDYERELKNI
jgi:hypothetical protein